MKVCILALSRSSSTNLLFTISRLHKFDKVYCEPFTTKINGYVIANGNKDTNSVDLPENIILKQILSKYNLPKDLKTIDELFQWVNKEFNKVICLYREDTKLQAESFLFHSINEKPEIDWWSRPKFVDMSYIPLDKIDFHKKQYDENTIKLMNFATSYNYPIFKYEDLIINEGDNDSFKQICEYLEIEFNASIIYELYRKERKASIRGEKPKLTKLI